MQTVRELDTPDGKSELLLSLLMVRRLIAEPQGADELCAWMGCSLRTLKRRIDDVRGFGVHVESVKDGSRWVYHVANAEMCEPRLSRWIELEEQRSLVDVDAGAVVQVEGELVDGERVLYRGGPGMVNGSFSLTADEAAILEHVLNRIAPRIKWLAPLSARGIELFASGCGEIVQALWDAGVPESVGDVGDESHHHHSRGGSLG